MPAPPPRKIWPTCSARWGIDYEAVVFAETADVRQAYDDGRCDGWTTDKSGLVANSQLLAVPDDHTILEATMSKEPLGPPWYATETITGSTSSNGRSTVPYRLKNWALPPPTSMISSGGDDRGWYKNLFGETGDLAQAMGLNNDFCYQVIKQVGNYGEI